MVEWWKWGALFWCNCINKMNECTMDHLMAYNLHSRFKCGVWKKRTNVQCTHKMYIIIIIIQSSF